jgi:urate oxidase
VPVNDRIFSTSVDLMYTFEDISIVVRKDEKIFDFDIPVKEGAKGYAGSVWDGSVFDRARKATVEVFAVDESASVQVSRRFL